MSQLDAIAPRKIATESLTVHDGTAIELRGLSVRDIAMLIRRFPAFATALRDSQMNGNPEELAVYLANEDLIDMLPAIVAAGLDEAGDARTETLVSERLEIEDQKAALDIIMNLTRAAARPLAGGSGGSESPTPAAAIPLMISPEPSGTLSEPRAIPNGSGV